MDNNSLKISLWKIPVFRMFTIGREISSLSPRSPISSLLADSRGTMEQELFHFGVFSGLDMSFQRSYDQHLTVWKVGEMLTIMINMQFNQNTEA